MVKYIISLFSCFIFLVSFGQNEEATSIPNDKAILIAPSFTFQIPMAEMEHRFGVNYNFGMGMHYKFGKNWTIGAEGNFLFGNNVKESGHIEKTLAASSFVITDEGALDEVNLTERGAMMRFISSKTIPFKAEKPNSGLRLAFGVGYFMHKILIDVNNDLTPQLSGEYAKGYDRLTQGVVFSQYIGLLKLEKSKYVNLSFGIEMIQGITKSARPFDFYQGRKLDNLRMDMLIGVKLSWLIPVFIGESSSSDYYYY